MTVVSPPCHTAEAAIERKDFIAHGNTPTTWQQTKSSARWGSGSDTVQRHIWSEYLDIAEAVRKTELGKSTYQQRGETIERVLADAKEKHGMRYIHHRGLARVTSWVTLKYAAMNLERLARGLGMHLRTRACVPFPLVSLMF